MQNEKNLHNFEKKININFKDQELLKQVFVHRSYLNENPRFSLDNNERLEFLGDAVLELIITEYLYKNYDNPEGELTNWRSALVRGQMLSKIAEELGINEYLFLSRGEQKSTGKARQIILANAFEALTGAIYLDQGYDVAKKFVHTVLTKYLNEIIDKELYKDAKSRLQELSQDINAITPVYRVLSESGPDHAKIFVIGVYIGDNKFGEGEGDSKQEAEQKAAEAALEKLHNK
jgi:ribonuclease-3